MSTAAKRTDADSPRPGDSLHGPAVPPAQNPAFRTGNPRDPFVGINLQFADLYLCLGRRLVKIVTTSEEGLPVEAFTAGTLAGAGSFRCESCGFAVALHELDEVPGCPQCGGRKFKRASVVMARQQDHTTELDQVPHVVEPDWLSEAREALVANGDY